MASQYHTTSGDSALVARPNRLGHSNKTKGKGGKAPGRIMIAAGKLKSWKHDGLALSAVKMALMNDPGKWYSVGRDSVML